MMSSSNTGPRLKPWSDDLKGIVGASRRQLGVCNACGYQFRKRGVAIDGADIVAHKAICPKRNHIK